ncbi:uncharacterized protein CEXT_442851, partial [Caerostris extrusa]
VLPKCLSIAHFVPREMPEFIALGPGPVIVGSSTPSTEDCSKFNAEDCLDDLQTFMRLTALPFTSDPSELNRLCKRAINGYNCSTHLYRGNCLPPKQNEMLPIFISSAEYMFFMLCGDGSKTPGYLSDGN